MVGESGCGKSTIVSLILRFYDVNSGRILIDGKDIKEYRLDDLRQIMGLVMQEPTLFNYTITENILYGKNDASNSDIRYAAEVANALEFIESNKVSAFDDSAEVLLREVKRYEGDVKAKIGEKEYQELVSSLEAIKKEEEEKGKFLSVEGNVDLRGQEKKDMELSKGFNIDCGLKGCKLSGG